MLLEHADRINDFVKLESLYEEKFLQGNYKECLDILDRIESSICVSIWSLGERLSVEQNLNGLKSQKKLADSIKKKSSIVVSFFIHLISNKLEDKVSHHWYRRNIDSLLEDDANADFASYIRYRVISINALESKPILPLLMWEVDGSIIDIYLTYIRCLQKYFSEFEKQIDVPKIVRNHIKQLAGKIDDFRMKKIALCVGEEINISDFINESSLKILNFYTRGDYEECRIEAEAYLREFPIDISIAEIYAKCCIRGQEEIEFKDSRLGLIINSISAILRRQDDIFSHYNSLLKEVLIGAGLNYSYQIDSFIRRELSEIRSDHDGLVNMGYLNSKIFTPLLCNSFASVNVVRSIMNAIEVVVPGETLELYKIYRFSDDFEQPILSLDIPESRKRKLIANRYFFGYEFDRAIIHYGALIDCNDPISSVEVLGHFAVSCIGMGDFKRGCELIANSYVKNRYLHLNLPFRFAVDKLGITGWPKTIDIPILFYIYSEHASKDKLEYLRYSFEYFLTAMGVERPSDLDPNLDGVNKEKLKFFLEQICVYDVMKRHLPLKGKNDVDKERINILNTLRRINPNEEERYLKEIRNITQKLVVMEGVKSVSRSKIYVDTESIKSHLADEIGEMFERYKDLLRNSVLDIEFRYASEFLGDVPGEEDVAIVALIRRTIGGESLIEWMVHRIIEEFVYGEHGLNNFLSSRIRHGTLLNTLSNPLLGEKLLTTKDGEGIDFLPNESWLSRLGASGELKDDISSIFSKFSEGFYSIVSSVKNSKIQVSYNRKQVESGEDSCQEALFDFKLYTGDVAYAKDIISENMEYRDFMDKMFDWIWKRKVESNLASVRDYISNDLKANFRSLFERFIEDLDNLPNFSSKDELKSSLTKARVNLNSAVDEVNAWFNRAEVAELNDFTVNIPLEIADKMISGFDDSRRLFKIEENIDEMVSIKGGYLHSFVDIFYPLLDNVIQRSRLSPNQLWVVVSTTYSSGILSLRIVNNIAPKDCIDEHNRELDQKIKKHLSDVTPSMLAKEGGTGFYKIIKAIRNGLGSEIESFKAFHNEIDQFTVEISFGVRGLLV